LLQALAEVAAGLRHLCKVAQEALERLADQGLERHSHLLTCRERQVVELIMADKNNAEIAYALGLHTSTVETHRKNIFHKLNVHTVVGLVRYAMERGWDVRSTSIGNQAGIDAGKAALHLRHS
jgi:DNA-binding NarL/FixJ family response regulator